MIALLIWKYSLQTLVFEWRGKILGSCCAPPDIRGGKPKLTLLMRCKSQCRVAHRRVAHVNVPASDKVQLTAASANLFSKKHLESGDLKRQRHRAAVLIIL